MKNKFKYLKSFKILVVFVVLVLGLTACGTSSVENSKSSSGKSNKVVTINVAGYWGTSGGITTYDPLVIAQKLGYFKNIKIVDSSVPTGPQTLSALTSDRIQVAMLQYSIAASATAKGAKLKAVATAHGGKNDSNFHFYVPKDSSIHSPKDLIGKSVGGIQAGSTEYYAWVDWLKKGGVSPDDVKLVTVQKGTVFQVLEKKQLAGVGTWNDFEQKPVEESGKYRLLFTTYDVFPGDLNHCGLFLTQKFIDENPEAVKELVTGFVKVNNWLKKNPEKGKEMHIQLAKERHVDSSLVEKYYTVTDIRANCLVKKNDAQYFIDKLEEYNYIPKGKVKASDLYTNEFNPYASQGDK